MRGDLPKREPQLLARWEAMDLGWNCHDLPIEWKIEEDYRKHGRDKDAVPVLQFRAECRAYAEHWMGVQAQEFRRLGVAGDWAHRYATMDFPSRGRDRR